MRFLIKLLVFLSVFPLYPAKKNQSGWYDFYPQEEAEPLANPYKGFVSYVSETFENTHIPQTLAYDNFTWDTLEPQKGLFDWAAVEKEWQKHISLGRKIGIRFATAYPGKERTGNKNADIPGWLIQKGVELREYKIDNQTGMAPDWDNPVFLEEHARIMKVLGQRYNNDPRIAWIDVGSYGFWGEWHVYKNPKLAAKNESKLRILQAYINAFPDKKLVIPFDDKFATRFIIQNKGGLRNDCLGTSDNNNWYLESLAEISKSTGADVNEEVYKKGFITGEFCGSHAGAVENINKRFEATLDFIRKTHWSFIGPAGGILVSKTDEKSQISALTIERAKQIHKALGYRFMFTKVSVKQGRKLLIKASLANSGTAPFYFKWPAYIALTNSDNKTVAEKKLTAGEWDITTWLPGNRELQAKLSLPRSLKKGAYRLIFYIIDPETQKPGIYMAMKEQVGDRKYLISRIELQ